MNLEEVKNEVKSEGGKEVEKEIQLTPKPTTKPSIKDQIKTMLNAFSFKEDVSIEEQEKYVNAWEKTIGKRDNLEIFDLDFNGNWWDIFVKLKSKLIPLWGIDVINQSSWILFPILIAWVIQTGKYEYLFYLIFVRILVLIVSLIYYRLEPEVFMQTKRSVTTSATKFFMEVDPINHSLRSTGTIISKVNRGSSSIENLVGTLTWDILPTAAGLLTTFFALLSLDWQVGLTSILLICILLTTSILIQNLNTNFTNQYGINLEDKAEEISIENLQQIQFIRSVFATENQFKKQIQQTRLFMQKNTAVWMSFVILSWIPLILYYLAVLILGWLVMYKINVGEISLVIGSGILGTYFLGSNNILSMGEKVRRISQSIKGVEDLYKFIQSFGKSTFPVIK